MDPSVVRDFAIALLIGALVGIERERRKAGAPAAVGGIRTFILLAETGALSAWLSLKLQTPWIFVAAVAAVAAAVVAAYVLENRAQATSLGLTTEMAALAVTLLGGV